MKPIRFTIICPAAEEFRVKEGDRGPSWQMKIFRFSMLSATSVAACSPDDVRPRIVDENVEPVNLDAILENSDIAGISFMTFNAPRAYEIADRLRKGGIPVIAGGYHPTLLPEEAAGHCDAVCVGDAEGNVPLIFEDFRKGRLRKIYDNPYPQMHSLPQVPALLNERQYIISSVLQATRGCSNKCGFCSISSFYKSTFRSKPLAEVIAEVEKIKGKTILFIDDNLGADSVYAKTLFRAMIPLRKRWFSQIGVNAAQDVEMLKLMRDSGCRGVFVGFEEYLSGQPGRDMQGIQPGGVLPAGHSPLP